MNKLSFALILRIVKDSLPPPKRYVDLMVILAFVITLGLLMLLTLSILSFLLLSPIPKSATFQDKISGASSIATTITVLVLLITLGFQYAQFNVTLRDRAKGRVERMIELIVKPLEAALEANLSNLKARRFGWNVRTKEPNTLKSLEIHGNIKRTFREFRKEWPLARLYLYQSKNSFLYLVAALENAAKLIQTDTFKKKYTGYFIERRHRLKLNIGADEESIARFLGNSVGYIIDNGPEHYSANGEGVLLDDLRDVLLAERNAPELTEALKEVDEEASRLLRRSKSLKIQLDKILDYYSSQYEIVLE